ncbi:MAG TPA: hypothetical protein QGF95_21525 [Candidatus Latescibacteria bacterium]|jgi:protein involved in polysaccharide export with SLBB domain|nr:hypothetical protein [Gemmatimonadaceae bacterium]MDP6016232.1 hypothetical protein [Candidatus Latescibacterota bacterium]HJP33134.1 hypothetical protein [Candidatus Latescibacterota bacterium]|tara:strand:+ start:325 stop:672 length:348 start_codon:yes stop_codon:yes gene_type:complete
MSTSYNLDGIRVQTARMLEIYSLLRRELEGANKIGMPQEARGRLQQAVDTIAANMAQLAAQLAAATETPSAVHDDGSVEYPGIGRVDAVEARELEEILDSVLKWHAELIQNDTGE